VLAGVVLLAVLIGGAAVALWYQIKPADSANDGNSANASPSSSPARASKSAQEKSSTPNEPTAQRTLNLSGEWNVVNTIETTSYPAYANLRLGYHLVINQTGTEFTGDGEKSSENGRSMADYERTPIHVTGSVNQNRVTATFVEAGQRRSTSGSFDWTMTGGELRGTFSSTAAKSSGQSIATRDQ
jgi:hypothetical protein